MSSQKHAFDAHRSTRFLLYALLGVVTNILWNVITMWDVSLALKLIYPEASSVPGILAWIGNSGIVAFAIGCLAAHFRTPWWGAVASTLVFRITEIPALVFGSITLLRNDTTCPWARFSSPCMHSFEMISMSVFVFAIAFVLCVVVLWLISRTAKLNTN
jgi:hypothetical protein